ncbi:MAG TPA: hypothetical protein VM050_03615 [Patescibacteria group bacterium]|nr:hypothetical protein [Patescibacteria group bacterium]
MTNRNLSAPWLVRMNWDELAALLICLSLDLLEYVVPVLMAPFIGDVVDLFGVASCVFFFNWMGFLALFELLPGFDVIPVFTLTWLIWYLFKRRSDRLRMEEMLEDWK